MPTDSRAIEQKFFKSLTVSERTVLNYRNCISSSYVRSILKDQCDTTNLFDITNLEQLWKVYSFVNLHETNVRNHRIYSTAIMKYMRFLNNGEKYGRRIDCDKPKKRVKKQ